MGYTDQCDLYTAVNEAGINRVAWHVRRQRPSLFNYASPQVVANPGLWCSQVDVSQDVKNRNNPVFNTELPGLPVLGSDSPPVLVNYCGQLTAAEIDFFPSNVFQLPAMLNPPLKPQELALHARVCAGVGCPLEGEVQHLPPQSKKTDVRQVAQPPVTLYTRDVECFCLDVYAVGTVIMRPMGSGYDLTGEVVGVDVEKVAPAGLQASINCYLKTTIAVILWEKLNIALTSFLFNLPMHLGGITFFPTPNPPIQFNPAVEDDQLKAFVSIKVGP